MAVKKSKPRKKGVNSKFNYENGWDTVENVFWSISVYSSLIFP